MRADFNNFKYNKTDYLALRPRVQRNEISFSGLTKTARSHIFIESALLGEIAGVKNADIVGEPPAEFVLALKEAHPKENISAEIKNIMKSFTLAAGVLREAEKHSFDGRDFETLQYARMLDEAVSDGNSFGAQNLFQKLLRMQATRQTFSPVLDDAASHIGKAFKEAGILLEDASVNLDFLSEGGRGYAFKVSFLDNEGEKLYHDKILKLYRSPLSSVAEHLAKTVYEYTNEKPDEYLKLNKDRLTQYYEANADYLPNYYNLPKKTLVEIKVDDTMLSVEYFQRKQKKKTEEELFREYSDFVNEFVGGDTYHGVFAEASSSLFIKKRAGKIEKTNYIEPWFFSLKSGCCLMEASDDELPAIKKEVDLDKFGLYHSDLEHNLDNVVKGRVIDYGGIQPK